MRVFFNFLVEFDYIERSPMRKIKQLKNARHSVDFITDSQFESIIGSLDMAKFHEYRDKVIIELLLDSGMRIGECLAIQMSDIDLLKNCIVLPWENTKGKKTAVRIMVLPCSSGRERCTYYEAHGSRSHCRSCGS